jgi:deoxyribodipyrimidine photo-lyase
MWRSIRILDATIRHFAFIKISFHPSLHGLVEVSESCEKLNINLHLLGGQHIEEFKKANKASALVCDFSLLRIHREWVDGIKKALSGDVPLCDALNIVQIWIASGKQEYATRTIRNKINSKLDEFLTEFSPLIEHPHKVKSAAVKTYSKAALESVKVDRTVGEVDWYQPRYKNAVGMLESFIEKQLIIYDSKRNDPTVNALSNMSSYFHFGGDCLS